MFVFAGATSYDFENFGPCKDDNGAVEDFKLLKGPDFKSRLHGFPNASGPKQCPPSQTPPAWRSVQHDVTHRDSELAKIIFTVGIRVNQVDQHKLVLVVGT